LLHALAWWRLTASAPEPAAAEEAAPRRPALVVALLPSLPAPRASANASPNKSAAPRPRIRSDAGARAREPALASTSMAVRPAQRSVSPPAGTLDRTVDPHSALERIGRSGASSYRSNAERAAAAAGSTHPALAPAQRELSREAAKAAYADCRRTHADMGLLALPMLTYETLSPSGCRW